MMIPQPSQTLSRGQPGVRIVREHCDRGIEHWDLNLLTFACSLAVVKRTENGGVGVKTCREVTYGGPDFKPRPIW